MLCAYLLTFLIATVAGYGDGIIVLDQNNFDDVLSQIKHVMVEFYLPGCTACSKFAHEYGKVAENLAFIYPHMKFFEVDGSTETSLVDRYNIKRFPTTLFFVRGSRTPLEYQGKPVAEDIIEWIKAQSDKVSIEVQTLEEAGKYIRDNDLVGFFFGSSNSHFYSDYIEVARHFDEIVFINSNNPELARKFGLQDDKEGFMIFKKFDERKTVYFGPLTIEGLSSFIRHQKYPAIMPFDKKAIQRIFYDGDDALFLFKTRERGQEAEEALRAAAREIKDRIAITIVNYEDDYQIAVTELFSVPLNDILVLSKDELPALILLQPKNRLKRYVLEAPITIESIKMFVEDFQNDKLKPLSIENKKVARSSFIDN